MDDKGRQPLAIGLLALVVLLLRGIVSVPASDQGTGQVAAEGRSVPPSTTAGGAAAISETDAVLCVLRDFLGPAGASGFSIESLVALVPHPTRSRLAAVFDTHVQAIQRALEDAGYLLQRQWLPWTPGVNTETGEGTPPKTACGQPAAASAPGVLLFRKTGDPQLLLVLLVPESPTFGIDTPVFLNALDVLTSEGGVARSVPLARDSSIRVLGPTFSGSVGSLKRALASWSIPLLGRDRTRALQFEIVSGSVTGARGASELGSTADYPIEAQNRIHISFHTTLHSDEYVERLFFHYLQNRNIFWPGSACPTEAEAHPPILKKVALLVESNTVYGSKLLGRAGGEAAKSPRIERTAGGILKIPFPMHIGQLRAEWAKSATAHATNPKPAVDLPQLALELPTDEVRNGQDIVPSFSTLTTRVDDLVLAQIAPAITRNDIRYVGLAATDVQDRLFLARIVRKYCPDVTLFALGSDILYTHPEYASDLDGMLLASTYPLFTENQVWTFPHGGRRRLIQFPTSEAEGVFNAALALAGRPDRMVEYGSPLQKPGEEQTTARYPPVWVSAVGRGAIWPVGALCLKEKPPGTAVDDEEDLKRREDELLLPVASVTGSEGGGDDAEHPREATVTSPTFFKVYGLAFVMLCVLHAVAYHVVLSGRQGWPLMWRLFALLEPSRDPDRRFVQRLYVYASFFMLTVAYAWITVPLLLRLAVDRSAAEARGELALECAVQLVGWAALMVPLVHNALRCRATARTAAARTISYLAIGASVLPIAMLIKTLEYAFGSWTDLLQGIPVEKAWIASFYLRASNLASGLSPLLPMFFLVLALYLWSLCELRRLHLGESAADYSAVAMLAGAGSDGLHSLKGRVDGLLADSFRNLRTCFGVFGVVTAFFWITVKWLPPSLDGRWFVGVFEVLLFLVTVAITFELARFFLCWVSLKRMLQRFAWLSLGPALKRMPELIGSARVLDLARARPGLATLRLAIERWAKLAAAWKGSPDPTETRALLEEAMDAEAVRPWRFETLRRELQARVNVAQAAVVEAWNEGRAAAGRDGRGADAAAWQEAAEDFVAIGIVGYLRYVLAHLRNLLGFATGASLLVLLAISSYPFQPAQLLLTMSWVAILSLVCVSVIVFVQMDRDEVLSLLSKTAPGQVAFSRELLSRLATYGLVPVLGVAAAQFPGVGRFFFFWVQPFLNALK